MLKIISDYSELGYEFKFYNCNNCKYLHLIVSKDIFKDNKYVETIGASSYFTSTDFNEYKFICDLNETIKTIEKIIKNKQL